MKEKLKNLSRNGPGVAITLFAFVIGTILFVPVCILLEYVLWGQIETASNPELIQQKVGVVAFALTMVICPAMAARTKVKHLAQQQKPAQPARYQPDPASPTQKPVQQKSIMKKQRSASKPEAEKPKGIPPQTEDQKLEETPKDSSVAAQQLIPAPVASTVTFDDIAGYAETKRNMEFIVKCLKNPELLKQVGAKVPAGILFYGPPGTGKTLMAQAIAGTAGVNFYSANASEFVQLWCGQGAINVRALYKAAKEHAPSIVFIDELDAIGGARVAGQNQEYRQTLNALLTEMDGMDKDSGVLTIAATNDFENLDSALIRPGRFDRKIMIPLPNMEDRLAIVKLYAAKRAMDPDISLEKLARETVGMGGSAIATLFNEASIRAVMADRAVITNEDLDDAMTQMLTNGEAAKASNPEDLKVAAYHEAGHTVIMRLLAHDPVQKVSIIGSTIGAVGMTVRTDNDDRVLVPVEVIRARIIAAYGGRAAEELVFGKENVTVGARQDIQDASAYIREYLDCGAGNNLLHAEAFTGNHVAPDINEARRISVTLYNEALKFLSEHRDSLERVAQALLDKETIMEEELEKLL